MALLRLVLEKFFLRAAVEQFTRLFEKFVHENAVRAQRRAVPLTYQEVVAIWNTYINPSPMSISSIDTLLDNKVDKKFQLMQSASGSGGKGGRSRNPSQSPKRIRLTNDVIWCPIITPPTLLHFVPTPQYREVVYPMARYLNTAAPGRSMEGAVAVTSTTSTPIRRMLPDGSRYWIIVSLFVSSVIIYLGLDFPSTSNKYYTVYCVSFF